MSGRHTDVDRSPEPRPVQIARNRALALYDVPLDQLKFMTCFETVRKALLDGVDVYPAWRKALADDNSIMLAAMVEAAASTRTKGFVK